MTASDIPSTAKVDADDSDFRVFVADREDLLALQRDAESRQWGTRWSSSEALTRAVGQSTLYICPFLRERRNGQLRSYRCFVLHSLPEPGAGGVSTLDIAPERLEGLRTLVLDGPSRRAFWTFFLFASNGISLLAKD